MCIWLSFWHDTATGQTDHGHLDQESRFVKLCFTSFVVWSLLAVSSLALLGSLGNGEESFLESQRHHALSFG
jgi:hypothetical protein